MAGLPMFDNAALTALVDRWRPKTHTFHLPCGELTVTLQDVVMILGLLVDGQPVCGNVQSAGWRDMVEQFVGRPPEPAQDAKDKKPSGVNSARLAQNFTEFPGDAAEQVIESYARAWLWHLVGGYLFPDGSGNTVSWMYLPILGEQWENVGLYSWGSATLAWLYRQLCDACRRSGDHANLGGCAYLLQVWMWERLPFEDEGSLLTVAFLCRNVRAVTGNAGRRYLFYTNELNCIMQSHVTWEPYDWHEIVAMGLSTLCTQDSEYWQSVLPLICFYIVEMHCPNRMMRQFGKLQGTPPDTIPTFVALHKIDKRKQRGARDWRDVHHSYLVQWTNRAQTIMHGGAAHRSGPYREYLRWLHNNSRLTIKPPRIAVGAEDLLDSDDEDDLGQQLGCLANEAGQALLVPPGSAEEVGHLRAFVERVRRSCRRLAYKMSCMTTPDVELAQGDPSSQPSAGHTAALTQQTPVHYGT
ncbi:serine/threonine-protein phosphatase 7 long form homolog [Phragmites australis]|uniref:serine/threonine-protein phosphatase 7 long form homolog n=1 Tax=Phragmites australis TaxID=29695 RepID=UPI002D786FA3|nr:serine/threonine-protein phosphatase 7 long form homolog [Phragmites australis]